MMTKKVFMIIVVACAIVAAGVWYWMSRAPEELSEAVSEDGAQVEALAPAEQLGGDLLEKAQNPLKDELPQTNPFTGAETNPFIDVYENPFAQ